MTSYAPEHLPLGDRPSMCFCSVAGPLLLLPQAAGTSKLIGPFGGRSLQIAIGRSDVLDSPGCSCLCEVTFLCSHFPHCTPLTKRCSLPLFTTTQRGIVSQPWKRSTTTTTHTHD